MDLVSICIPTYNGADYLNECLLSARTQTYSHLEILVVDDKSSDRTLEIVKYHAALDSRIRVEQNSSNLGLVGNWNRCIALASGQWIKFLFQDDLLAPDCVKRLVDRAEEDGSRLIGCARDFIFDSAISKSGQEAYNLNQQIIHDFLGPNRGATAKEYARRILTKFNYNYFGEPTVSLVHRSVFDDFGLFDEGLSQICDVEYWIRVASHIGLAFVPEKLAYFRVHGGATSAKNLDQKFLVMYLDPLTLMTYFIERSEYCHLRDIWRQQGLYERVLNISHQLANEAFEVVSKNPNQTFKTATIASTYAEFIRQYPRYKVSKLSHWLWKKTVARYRIQILLIKCINRLRGKTYAKPY